MKTEGMEVKMRESNISGTECYLKKNKCSLLLTKVEKKI